MFLPFKKEGGDREMAVRRRKQAKIERFLAAELKHNTTSY